MRAISDRKLPEPYRSWIDRGGALPSTLRLFPRTIDVGTDCVTFLSLGTMMGVMGVLFLILPPWRFSAMRENWPPYVFLAVICAALWSVPLLLGRRLWITLRAQRELKRGTLRQGVLLGAEGMLVRMESNRCHPIASSRFVVAKRFPPERSQDRRKPTVIIETLDGTVEFFAERLAARPHEINRAASELWPAWKKPGRLVRADRRKLADLRTRSRMYRAIYFFTGAMLLFAGGFLGVIVWGDRSPAAPAFSLALFAGLVLVVAATVNVFLRFLALKGSYRCPECRERPARVYEALPAIHFYCPACNVEWDIGLSEQGSN